jgi:F-type H+-transporting ATPase subunit delta
MASIDKRYAEALVDVAELNGSLDAAQSELGIFVELYDKQPEFVRFFISPEIGKEEKKITLKSIFNEPESITLTFIQLLIDKDRFKNLPGIYKEYVDLAEKRKRVLNLKIRSFASIDEAHLDKIKEKYMKEYNASDLKTTISIEPALLGGIVVQIGDRVIDGSIKSRLNGLRDITTKMQQLKAI